MPDAFHFDLVSPENMVFPPGASAAGGAVSGVVVMLCSSQGVAGVASPRNWLM